MLANYAVCHQRDHERSSFRDFRDSSYKKEKDKKKREERHEDRTEIRHDDNERYIDKHEEDGNERVEDRLNLCKNENDDIPSVLENKTTVDFESSALTKPHESTNTDPKGINSFCAA